MLSKDDRYFYKLLVRQLIHQKKEEVVAKMPERVDDGFKRERIKSEDIESKYETRLGTTPLRQVEDIRFLDLMNTKINDGDED